MSIQSPGMLLFPFGNLSHTSILYYTILYVEVKYNVFKNDDSYIGNLRT
jgi:hypothetical protein